jgi:multisubunit Na+/H+ antiporter MnhB subunit
MKLLVVGVLVLFVGFWMVQAPDSLAHFLQDGGAWTWDTTSMVFSSLIDFLGTLFG